jgi:acyl-CoA synthetase (AMP-forming)/AMP-acid ligase II
VGRLFPQVELRIIEPVEGPIADIELATELPAGSIGEIVVKGPSVTREYFQNPEATAAAKIADGEGFWHRIGDVGYVDEEGRLWFCGRKAHVVDSAEGPMYSVCCEAIFNEHPHVFRSALVGIGPRGRQRPVIVVEPEADHFPNGEGQRERFRDELRRLGAANTLTTSIDEFLFHAALPVDVRHNVKIARGKLAVWAAEQLPPEGAPRTEPIAP